VLDLGTGTGCLLVALLSECPLATGLGVDVSAEAVAAAAANAARHGLAARAGFRQGDWFAGLEERFDVILANPPYIARAVIQGLAREVRAHDPLLALDGGEDGLEAYRAILAGARACLEPDGIVILELGAGQAEAVRAIAAAEGLVQVGLRADLGGHPRALALRAWGPKPVQEPP
jgi:release factor glutamine methyltransferase